MVAVAVEGFHLDADPSRATTRPALRLGGVLQAAVQDRACSRRAADEAHNGPEPVLTLSGSAYRTMDRSWYQAAISSGVRSAPMG